jgi:3-deoxy-D-manno-octulosonic-acid transferase
LSKSPINENPSYGKSSYLAYRWLTACGSLVLVPLIWLHHRFRGHDFNRFYQRLGRYDASAVATRSGRPRIWIHAVSVGEVGVAAAICKELFRRHPHAVIFVSTLREQGMARIKELLGDSVTCFFAPLDLVGATRRALQMVQPDLLVLLETEIWPNLIVGARRMGVRTAIANGRLSVRSIKKYRKVFALMRYTLSHVDAFSMISTDDADRLQSLGADPARMSVAGNAKFDIADPLADRQAGQWAGDLFAVGADTPVFVAGSTRHPEEQMLLEAFTRLRRKFPQAVLILAPRHIERSDQVRQWAEALGLTCQLRTRVDPVGDPRRAAVVILDTMGELSDIYGIADMVFCGGSLVPKGGQNILEPAMWGKPVIYGPSMEDFLEAKEMIQSNGGGVLVRNVEEMVNVAAQWMQSPQIARSVGEAARKAVLPHGGAAAQHADVISRLLENS